MSSCAGPISAKRKGSRICGERQALGEPVDLVLVAVVALVAERGRGVERGRFAVVEREAGERRVGAMPAVTGSRRVLVPAVHDDRAERDAGPVLDRVRGVDQLVDRRLLRQGDEHHLAAVRVGEQLDHVLGLVPDRADLHRVEQPPRRQQEADRVPGRGGVEDDQVGGAGALERLHLAQHEDVPHPGHRGRDDVERAGAGEPPGDPAHTVVLEVLEQGLVGGQGPGPDPGPDLGFLVVERARSRRRSASPDLPSTSTISTLMPVRAAAVASAAVTVVLPTPPLPATITTREAEQNRSSSIDRMLRERP